MHVYWLIVLGAVSGSEAANPSRQPHLPTFIVYDVLDVIGGAEE
jgi:hypothetical protein